ncbi:MAG: protein-disulfide isomerase [Gammaproteobacteria bacterium]|nr:MAG: protein-disulfide isomerase [Gammaproteobacteria bacterium]
MIFRVLQSVLVVALVVLAPLATAGEPVDKAQFDKLRAALEVSNRNLKVSSVKTSEIAGLYEVQFLNGPTVYSTANGDYFLLGDMFSVGPQGYVNLAEKRREKHRASERAEKIAAVAEEDMIVFSPQSEPKARITVFTDVTCFYCQKLHKEVPQLNKNGVEVRYLAYPRAGVDSAGFKQLASAWCADNPQETLTRLKNKKSVPENVCPDNPIAAQFQLGQELGVRGTPAIVTQDGQMIPGYQSADELMVTLGLN